MNSKTKKQEILGVSNHSKFISIQISKQKNFYSFLFSLLKEFSIEIPDLYDSSGNLPNIFDVVDSGAYYSNKNNLVHVIIGWDSVFLIIETDKKTKIIDFLKKNTNFTEIYY